MKVLGISFTISTLLGSAARSISAPVFFFLIHIYLGWAGEGLGGLSGEGSGTRREGVAVTARLSRLSQIQFEQSQRPEWIYYQTCPKLQHLTEGAAVSTSSWEGEERMRQGCGHM